MANQIERDVFVKSDKLKNPVPYTRGTDLLPIVFHFRDFSIPSGATARVFVAKPDGNAVYDSATIEGNDVTVDVTEQMFLVLGMTLMQISIFDGEEELVSFAQPVMVEQNLKAGDFPKSTTDVSFLDDAIEQANQAVNTATTAASQAAHAVQNANQAIDDANDAISDLNAQIALLNTNFASLANNVSISQLQTTAKTLVEGINELNSKMPNNAGSHNGIYRGKSLGSSVTQAQWNAIQAGTFDDLFIGDYWTIGGVNWRIAAFDYYYNTGDTAFTKHHVVIVPDTSLYTHVMNDTNITTGAYVGSKMYTEGLDQAKTTINNAFGSSHVLSHRIYLSNATSNGRASEGVWADSTVDLMCEHMVYGSGIFSPVSDGSIVPNNYRVEKSQLPLFTLDPTKMHNRSVSYWLRDVISSAYFAYVYYAGYSGYYGASGAAGVRPAFCIGI